MTPGIHPGITNEDYHSGPGISKSGLWTISTKTPAHYRYEEREEQDSAAKDRGTATHLALLEPEKFDTQVFEGPDDRRGNRWKDAQLAVASQGGVLLTSGDYGKVLRMRDQGEQCTTLRHLRRGAMIEASGYAIDAETGMLCRVRPDIYNPIAGAIADIKSARDGGARGFSRAAAEFGYHMQEAFYTDVWRAATLATHGSGGAQAMTVDAFVFIVVESTAPFLVSAYELAPSAVDEGREAYKRALRTYAECSVDDVWPGYPEEIEPLDIPAWAYKHTIRPQPEEA
jgi:exodeoxyribonuclease VIII